jgi:hypothetical protein
VSGFAAHRRRVIEPTRSLTARLATAARAAADAGSPVGNTAIAAAALATIATLAASVAARGMTCRRALIWRS